MAMNQESIRAMIRKLIKGEDYRAEVITLIDAVFLDFTIEFFKKVTEAKFKNNNITLDWYKKEFLDSNLDSNAIATNSGLNKKTIHNMYNKSNKKIVIEASTEHYDSLRSVIQSLVDKNDEIDITLTVKFNSVSVDLNITESLIVINALAVKRAALRGGMWSSAGKRVEGVLMECLCKLYSVPSEYYSATLKGKKDTVNHFEREVDFYLLNNDINYKCEVKLMGKGNPESADAVIARGSKIFIADKLSQTNMKQLDSLKVEWVELRSDLGFRKFGEVLKKLNIPHNDLPIDIDRKMVKIFEEIF